MSFVHRKITVIVRLGQGSFGEDGSNTVTLTGYRVQAHIEKVPGPGQGQAEIRVYGLKPALMAQLSALNSTTMAQRNNVVTLLAGDDETGMALVFQGTIMLGQICLNTQPDASLLLFAQAGGIANVQVAGPASYPGSADVATVLGNIAVVAGWGFENYGVDMKIQTPYLWGSPMDQLRQVGEAGEGVFDYHVDDGPEDKRQTLVIWPKGGQRGSLVPLISPATGMVGYPNYSTSVVGLDIKTIFNPHLVIGGPVKVELDSSCPITVPVGVWLVWNICHDIESETPNGQWFTNFSASSPKP